MHYTWFWSKICFSKERQKMTIVTCHGSKITTQIPSLLALPDSTEVLCKYIGEELEIRS